jgi:hypothetical protein
MKTLKSMVEFVLDENNTKTLNPNDLAQKYINCLNHALLLSQQPNIGMFVPAVCKNGVWRVLEEPELTDKNGKAYYQTESEYNLFNKEYQQAKSNVIFKGFEIVNKNFCQFITDGKCYAFYKEDNDKLQQWKTEIHTLEDLVKFNLELI